MAKENIGGQALVDGVLFRNQNWVSIARRQGEEIILEVYPTIKLAGWKKAFSKIPILRGILAFLLIFLSFLQLLRRKRTEKRDRNFWLKRAKQIAFIFFVLMVLPFILDLLLWPLSYYDQNVYPGQSLPISLQIGEKLLTYFLVLLSFSILVNLFYPTLFAYHGAEHKSIATYERNRALIVQEARKSSRLHSRCGTSFFAIIALADSFFLTPFLAYYQLPYEFWGQLFLIGLAYEISLYLNKHCNSLLSRVISPLGLLLQRVTTKEPSSAQLEVALAALQALPKNNNIF